MSQQNNNSGASWGYRFVALLAVAIAALAVVVIPFQAIVAASGEATISGPLLDIIQKASEGDDALFGIIPAFALTGTLGTVYNLSIYLFAACIAIAAILGLIGLFAGKGGIARTSIGFLAVGAAIYAISMILTTVNLFDVTTQQVLTDNIISLALVIGLAFLYCILAAVKVGKLAWLHFFQFLLSALFVALLSIPLAADSAFKAETLDTLPMIALYLGLAVVYLNTIIALTRMTRAGGIGADLARYIIVLLAALLVIFAAETIVLWPIVAAAIAAFQVVIVVIQMVNAHKGEVEQAIEDATEAAVAGFHTEEYAEAYAYEGGPVSGVVMAEEVNPSFLPHEPHVNTAGYDFYNCKSFDPFIATLDTNERNAFTEIFILKFKGTMPELPDYEVGGDNKEFFRKIFIYLGQYRDRIPQPLLVKMYQFSMKI